MINVNLENRSFYNLVINVNIPKKVVQLNVYSKSLAADILFLINFPECSKLSEQIIVK